ALELDRYRADVPDGRGLVPKERVPPVGRDENEEPPEAEEVEVCQPLGLPPRAGRPGEVDAVPLDELPIDGPRVLGLRHMARHVEPVARGQVVTHELRDAPPARSGPWSFPHPPPPRPPTPEKKGGGSTPWRPDRKTIQVTLLPLF